MVGTIVEVYSQTTERWHKAQVTTRHSDGLHASVEYLSGKGSKFVHLIDHLGVFVRAVVAPVAEAEERTWAGET